MADPELLERVRATGLLPAGGPVVVLLSGGRDSTCLLDLAIRSAGPASVRALHVNYGLRGDASDADEAHCGALCETLGVPLTVHRARRPEGAGNLQAWARDRRYGAGLRLAAEHDARVAAGHTVTDQVETILYRLAVAPGRRALLGMEAERGRLIRPLLAAGATRADSAVWCLDHGLAWRDDASNLDRAYARARVREDLVPALRAVDGRAEDNVLRTAALLRDEAAVLDEVVTTALAGRDHVAVSHLATLPRALARLVLLRLAEDAVGRLCPRAAGRLDDVLALGDGALDVGEGVRVIVEAGVLRMGRTPARAPKR
jgi:tRNA(Ile)-lysidine synthase